MLRVTSPASLGETVQQPGAAPGGGQRRNAWHIHMSSAMLVEAKKTTSPISFPLPPCPAQREKEQSQGCSSRSLGLYHTEAFSLISLQIPGLLLFRPGRCLEGLEEWCLLASQRHASAGGLGQLPLLLLKALPEAVRGVSSRDHPN